MVKVFIDKKYFDKLVEKGLLFFKYTVSVPLEV